MKWKVAVAILWLGCGFVNYGLSLGYFSHKFPWMNNESEAILAGLTGPLGLPADAIVFFPFHWQLKPYSTEQRWEFFQKEFPRLDRAYFEQEEN